MKLQKFFLSCLCILFISNTALANNYSQELQDAYQFAYQNKITTQNSIDKADMSGGLTRIAMAKMLSQYAINILGKTPDTSKIPNFLDVDSKIDEDYNNGVTMAYQLGIMGIGIDEFRPFDDVTRAEFGTALSRVVYGNKFDDGNPYYIKHLDALRAGGIMTHIDQPNQLEIRGYVMLMLMRSVGFGGDSVVDCNNSLTMLECELDISSCPIQCKMDNGEYISNYEISNNESSIRDLTGNLEFSEAIFLKSSSIRTGDVTFFNQFFVRGNVSRVFSIKFKKIGNIGVNHIKSIWLQNESGKKVSNVIDDLQNDEFVLNILEEYSIPSDFSMDTRTLAVVVDNLGIGTHDLGFKVLNVEDNAKYRHVGYRGDNRKLSLTIDKKLTANYQIELEIIDKKNNQCPDVFRKDEYYDMFNFIIHKKGSDPLVSLGEINIAGETEGFKNRLQDIQIYINGKKVSSSNYTWKILKYRDSAIGELHPLKISFKENIDIKNDSDVLIKGKYGGFNLEKYLSKYAGYTCRSGYWENGFTTRVTYENDLAVLYDKQSGQLLSGKTNIIDETGVDTLRSRTIEKTDNTHEWFKYQTYFVYTCDTFSDFYTSNGYGNMTIIVGQRNSFEENFGLCRKYNNSSSNNSNSSSSNDSILDDYLNDNDLSNDTSLNNNNSSNSGSSSNNNNSSNDNLNDGLDGDSTLNDNDLDNEDNSSEASNNSPNTSNNCVGIEVEDGSSYNFCVSRTYGSKFYMSVDNAGDLDKCVIGKGGQTRDFQTCNGDFTILGGGKSNLTLTIKYNNKSYSKTAYYDLDNGVFVNN